MPDLPGALNWLDEYEHEHHYLSTACVHGLHSRCRRLCKWCDVECLCLCHHVHLNKRTQP